MTCKNVLSGYSRNLSNTMIRESPVIVLMKCKRPLSRKAVKLHARNVASGLV